MANLQNYIFLGLLVAVSLLVSPAFSLTCDPRPPYSECADLPVLNASLHYNYYPANSTLSFAFSAPPPNPNGWVSWSIKSTASVMAPSEAFLAYQDSNGATVLKTYDLITRKQIKGSRLDPFYVLYQKAEFSNGLLSIYATVELPRGTTRINHAWRVGPGVKDGVPQTYDFNDLIGRGVLKFPKVTTWINQVSQPLPPSDCGSHDKHKDGRLFMLYQCSA